MSKGKFRQPSNRCRRVLEPAKLPYDNVTTKSITLQNLGSRKFWRSSDSVISKGKSAIPILFDGRKVLPSASGKINLFA